MKPRPRYLFLFLLNFVILALNATHNRAGEITYQRVAPFTQTVSGQEVEVYNYLITVTFYTNDGPGIADRCRDTLYFGDGDKAIAFRSNGFAGSCPNADCSPTVPCGEIILSDNGYVVKKNIFQFKHRYPGPGVYSIRTTDPNRNQNVKNIPNSVNVTFYIEAYLVINSFTGANTSPVFKYAPIDKACLGQCFQHNPGAYDVDGDSLSYEISTSRGANGQTVPGYSFPNKDGGTYTIDAITGLLQWCSPIEMGEYNLAFIVKEWRKNTNGIYQMIGYVFRDMQVIVGSCPNLYPPVISPLADTCVEAGAVITKTIRVTDQNTADYITLEGESGAFAVTSNPAVLTGTSGNQPLLAKFTWNTNCSHIREQPYNSVFKASDNGSTKQVTFASYIIKVVPPAIKGVTVSPQGTNMIVNWLPAQCNPTNNPITSYKIYRKENCDTFIQAPCTAIIPASSGFKLIGQVGSTITQYIDNNGGDGLVVGQNYSYLVVAFYSDGTQTFASNSVCGALKREVPVILNVDVLSTATNGSIRVRWMRPRTDFGNLDTNKYLPPYRFKLIHYRQGLSPDTVFTVTKNSVLQLDTVFDHMNINTTLGKETYQVEFMSQSTIIGFSQKATSVFLTVTPSDRRMDLSWDYKTPWQNTLFTIKRKGPGATAFTSIATTTSQTYTDENNVANKNTYCYLVVSEGAYSDITISKPLINKSQEACATATDLIAPCSPTMQIGADCPSLQVKVEWKDVRKNCSRSDDVVSYEVFYKPTVSSEFILKKTFTVTPSDTAFEYIPNDDDEFISGCYVIVAVDSSNNRSSLGNDFCIDNCPVFELPNIFTPNGDKANDQFKAIRVRQIKEIDLHVYDRWGNLVYKTTDPYFKWDGTSIFSNVEVSEGTFFYICDVYEPRVRGTVKRTLKGNVQVAR